MAEFKRIKIADIVIPERLRALEEDIALAISQSIVEHGLLNPVTVRATPAAKGGNYTLVAGRHRVRGVELTGETEIDATIVEADKAEAQLIEITENLFRNELSTLDRAIFVATYREVWQDKYGKIEAGRPGNRINLIQLIEDEAGKGFSEHVAERLGLSVASVKRLNQIAQNLHPDVRVAVRGTPIADNQSELLKIAKMEPKQQRRLAIAFRDEKDIRKARDLVEGATQPAKLDPEVLVDAMVAKLVAAWEGASLFARERFLVEVGIEPDPQMSSIIGEAE